jgi:hypothetical protein
MKDIDIKKEIYALLRSKGCAFEERSGIVFVTTSDGVLWDFTIPVKQKPFLEEGQRVRAKVDVYDLPGTPEPGPIHATPGELGTVVHTEPGFWPTVTFDRTGTSTCVTPEEVEKFDV